MQPEIKAGSHTLSSDVGFKGILRKFLILLVVALAHVIDKCVGFRGDLAKHCNCFLYVMKVVDSRKLCSVRLAGSRKNERCAFIIGR